MSVVGKMRFKIGSIDFAKKNYEAAVDQLSYRIGKHLEQVKLTNDKSPQLSEKHKVEIVISELKNMRTRLNELIEAEQNLLKAINDKEYFVKLIEELKSY